MLKTDQSSSEITCSHRQPVSQSKEQGATAQGARRKQQGARIKAQGARSKAQGARGRKHLRLRRVDDDVSNPIVAMHNAHRLLVA